jgi:lipopolysaccharide export system protein LptA
MYRNLRACLSFLFILVTGMIVFGQQQARRVEILNANSMEYDAALGEGVRRLLGDVRLMHENVIMTSDSAHVYDKENMVLAFSRVHFNQGDTVHLYGNFVRYSSRTKLAEAREDVILIDNETTLTTTHLDFDLNRNIAFYPDGAVIKNADSELQSRRGYYYTRQKNFYFSENVVITHPDYIIYSDTLKYNTITEMADFYGPTKIIAEDMFSYAETGWYNQKTDQLQFNQNAYIIKESQILKGDSIFYDRVAEYGRAINNLEVRDTIENVILKGNYSLFYRNPERMLITGRAEFIQVSDGDSLFLHADTLRSFIPEGSEFRIMKAYFGARFYKSDIQGISDSLVYNFSDSIIHMYKKPALWFENSQLTSDTIRIFTKNRKMDYMHMPSNAFMITDEGKERYSQVKGREMFGYFNEGRLSHFHVIGNVETIYYLKEEKSDEEEMIGVNKATSQQLIIRIKDNKPDDIVFITKPEGTLYPPFYLQEQDLLLQEFQWLDEIRPKDRNDIFRR